MNIISQNKIRAILAYALRTAALLCASGSLMQTFLSTIGFSEQYIYLHASIYQAANVLSIILFARFADGGNLLRRTALVQVPGALLFLCYMPLCAQSDAGLPAYLWLLVISIMQSVTVALHTVCEYKVPYFIYRTEEYGSVMAICGVVSSAVSFGVGALFLFDADGLCLWHLLPVPAGCGGAAVFPEIPAVARYRDTRWKES